VVQPNGKIINDANVLSILASASAPMNAPDLAKVVVSSKGEMPTDRNVRLATMRVREHLRRFRAQGLVLEVPMAGSRFRGWVLIRRAKSGDPIE